MGSEKLTKPLKNALLPNVTHLICCGNILCDSCSSRFLQVFVVGAKDVDLIRFFGQFPNSLKCDAGLGPVAEPSAAFNLRKISQVPV